MGLAVFTGSLAEMIASNDLDGAEYVRENLDDVNAVLRKHGLPEHKEPESIPPQNNRAPITSFSYSCLHYLRRAYAHSVKNPGKPIPALSENDDASDDPVIDEIASPKHHLLWYSDSEGFYVPIDFESAIADDELLGGFLGSSQRLFQELIMVAPALGITLDGQSLSDAEADRIEIVIDDEEPGYIENMVWILLFESARLSIEQGTAIEFC